MKRLIAAVSAVMLLLSPADAASNPPQPLERCSAYLQERLNAALVDIFRDTGIPDGVGAFGYFSMRGEELSVISGNIRECGPDHFFRIASCTKMFTAAAVAQLIADGAFALDGNIVPLIPPDYAVPDGDRITVHMLLNHKSGIFDPTKSRDSGRLRRSHSPGATTPTCSESDSGHNFTCDE